jgi:hypothetical protein
VQIPGGDLAPARRRRYGGSYGRRRRRRTYGLTVLAIVAVSGAAYYATRDPELRETVSSPTPTPCTTPSATPTAAVLPGQVRLHLLNGTSRNGLAKTVGRALEGRGFVVPVKANAPAALPGPTRVVSGPGAEAKAALVSSHITGSMTVSDPQAAAGSVQVTLGNSFQRLATAAEAAAAQPRSTPSTPACASLQR